jgi:hypothetical protein
MPDSILVRLKYTDAGAIRVNAAASLCSWRFRMNNPYDPDPLLGTGAVPGFVEWASFFRIYRVINFRYSIKMAGLDAIPGIAHTAPSENDLGANFANTYQLESTSPYGKTSTFSALAGGRQAVINGVVNMEKFFGGLNYLGNDAFGALTTTSPTTQLFFNIGFTTSAAMTLGVLYSGVFEFDVNFYSRFNLTG